MREIDYVAALHDGGEPAGIADRHRLQEHPVNHRENLGVDRDAEGQRQHHGRGVPGKLGNLTAGEAKIGEHEEKMWWPDSGIGIDESVGLRRCGPKHRCDRDSHQQGNKYAGVAAKLERVYRGLHVSLNCMACAKLCGFRYFICPREMNEFSGMRFLRAALKMKFIRLVFGKKFQGCPSGLDRADQSSQADLTAGFTSPGLRLNR